MSHFNLNNGLARRRYIGPTHGLKSSAGETSLENLGGRIIIESEMYCHKQRMKTVKPSIDSKLPWAHAHQEGMRRGGRPSSRGPSASGGRSQSKSIPPLTDSRGRPPSSGGLYRPQTGNAESATPGRGATRGPQNTTPSKGGRIPAPAPGGAAFDVTTLPPAQQDVYKGLVQLLATLPQRDAKAVLEQAYREGEERKLLMAYTGVFPDSSESSAPKKSSLTPAAAADSDYDDHPNVDRSSAAADPKPRGTPQDESTARKDTSDSEPSDSEPTSP